MNPSAMVGDVPVVAVDAISKVFDGPPQVVALKASTFEIGRGEFVAVTGPSGSGKTTLLSLLGLLDSPTLGHYFLNGLDVAGLSDSDRAGARAHQIGFVFQAFHLIGHRTVVENVELGLLYQGISKRERQRRALEVIGQVGLTSRQGGLCSQLSGGEKQRVAIARAVVRQPALLLCDEPTGNLDTESSNVVLNLLQQLHSGGLTVVVITHNPIVAASAKRNLRISDGVLSELGEHLS